MKCEYCKMRLVGTEEPVGLCIDCQIAKEDAENLNELNRYREMFPIPPWSSDPITPEVCERLGMIRNYPGGHGWEDESGCVSVRVTDTETWISGGGYDKTAGQLACLVAARKTDAKH